MNLTESQTSAIEYVKSKAEGRPYPGASELTINFHPDRVTTGGIPILLALQNDGMIKSQFESKTSNGALSAYVGGARWLWESKAFGAYYDSANDNERPKYGALNLNLGGSGGSPRFGSAYFVLKPSVLPRTTFCYPDSWLNPTHFSTFETINSLVDLVDLSEDDPLDAYIEAHIHGELILERDIEYLALDPSYKGTEIESYASGFSFPIKWHAGFELNLAMLSGRESYRGLKYINIAREIAVALCINPFLIGRALSNNEYEEQDLKKVWHYLACFGIGIR